MDRYKLGMNYCRRCGTKLTYKDRLAFVCENGHNIFYNSGTGAVVGLFNEDGKILVLERAVEAKGMWDLPGGFCDAAETLDESLEDGLAREVLEEVGLEREQYSEPQYVGSGINTYHFGGEVVPVLVALFTAQLKPGAQPKAGSDAARIWFDDLKTLDLDKLYSATSRRILAELRTKLT